MNWLIITGSHDTSNKIRKQIAWKQNTKEAVWTEIVTEKIRKQKELLELLGKEESGLLGSYLREIAWNDGTNREGMRQKYILMLYLVWILREQRIMLSMRH